MQLSAVNNIEQRVQPIHYIFPFEECMGNLSTKTFNIGLLDILLTKTTCLILFINLQMVFILKVGDE